MFTRHSYKRGCFLEKYDNCGPILRGLKRASVYPSNAAR